MNSREVTIAGYLVILAAVLGLQLAASRDRSVIPPLGTVFGRIMRTRPGRIGLLAAWAWIGLHFFAR